MAPTTLAHTKLSNRRSGNDRRNRAGISIRFFMGAGARKSIRRQEDRDRIFFVDWYGSKLFVAILAVIFLSVLDGFLTLLLLNHGAYEVNPIMAYLLDVSPFAFVAGKYALTCMVALIGLMLRNVVIRRIKLPTYAFLYLLAGAFAAVVAWELYLISVVIS